MSNVALPSAQEFSLMKEMGRMAVASGLLPAAINTPEKAVIIMMKGRELGIPPMQAFSSIAVINGKPTMSAELMLSMIYRNVPGAIVNYLRSDAQACEIEAQRPGGKSAKFAFTIEDARRANLLGKGPWQTYPSAMLRARTVSAMARAVFPDALSGVVYTPEELGAEVDDEGRVLDQPPMDQAEPEAREVTHADRVDDMIAHAKHEVRNEISRRNFRKNPGDHRIMFGAKYAGKTISEAVERDGHPEFQKWLGVLEEIAQKKGYTSLPPDHQLVADLYALYREDQMKQRHEEIPLTDEEEAQVERMIDEQRMGRVIHYTPEDALRDRNEK